MNRFLRPQLVLIRITLIMLDIAIDIPLSSSITHSHAVSPMLMVGPKPKRNLPFSNGTLAYIGTLGLDDHNIFAVTDDTTHITYSFGNSRHGNTNDPQAQVSLDIIPSDTSQSILY